MNNQNNQYGNGVQPPEMNQQVPPNIPVHPPVPPNPPQQGRESYIPSTPTQGVINQYYQSSYQNQGQGQPQTQTGQGYYQQNPPPNQPPAIPPVPPQEYYNQSQPPYYYQNPTPQEPYKWDYDNINAYQQKQPKPKKNKGLIVFLATLLCCLVVGVGTVMAVTLWDVTPTAPGDVTPGATTEIPNGSGDLPKDGIKPSVAITPKENLTNPPKGEVLSIPQIAVKVKPSVVGVLRYENTKYEPTGIGSGFIVDIKDGNAFVVSNAHVVEYGTAYKIRLEDGSEHDAQLVGADKRSDIALLKMKAEKNMIVAEIGDSDKLVVGEPVVAIGNPVSFELSGSVTNGIVSALDRKLSIDNSINYIQTNAAINPGNSGGALVNQYGQVIGINTMKIRGADYEGIGFAIPMSAALPILEELSINGRVAARPVLGITGTAIGEADAERLGIPTGIQVVEVSPKAKFSPEILREDIITHANGKRIQGLPDLKDVIGEHAIGDTLELTVYRKLDAEKHEEVKITVTLIESEE